MSYDNTSSFHFFCILTKTNFIYLDTPYFGNNWKPKKLFLSLQHFWTDIFFQLTKGFRLLRA